jgi:hypothetical protein
MRTFASWMSIVFGIVMVVAGVITWIVVTTTLSDQKITTSSDACLPDRDVRDPFTANCQAEAINDHVLSATDGKTYAELDQDDPLRETAMTGSFLQASLFTSVVAFGVALMAVGIGIMFVIIGFGLRAVGKPEVAAPAPSHRSESPPDEAPAAAAPAPAPAAQAPPAQQPPAQQPRAQEPPREEPPRQA